MAPKLDPSSSESVWNPDQSNLIRKWQAAASEVKAVLEYGRLASKDASHLNAFKARFSILDRYYGRFEELSDALFDLNSTITRQTSVVAAGEDAPPQYSKFPDSKQSNVLTNIRSFYMEALEIHQALCQPAPPPAPASGAGPSHDVTLSQDPSLSSLPKISIPRFDGTYQNWVVFRDTFTSLVHEANISNTKKFHYLISALTGPAKSVIAGFTISDENYPLAFQALKQAYQNPRVLANLHLQRLLKVKPPTSSKPTADSLRDFLSQVADTISAFKLLRIPDPAEFILYHLATRGLDAHTKEQFEFKLKRDDFPTMEQLTEFVRERQLALQICLPTQAEPSPAPRSSKAVTRPKTSLLTGGEKPRKSSPPPSQDSPASCPICSGKHGLFTCPKFNNMSSTQRFESLRAWKGCRNCLSASHHTSDCKSAFRCRTCQGLHHTKLCLKSSATSLAEKSPPTNLMATTLTSDDRTGPEAKDFQVLLGTASAQILDARGQQQSIRMVIDSASQYSYITHRCVTRLGLRMQPTQRQVSCLGGTLYEGAKGVLSCELRSTRDPRTILTTEAIVIPNITSYLPTTPLPAKIRSKYRKFDLADPKFAAPAPIDFLAGADLFPYILSGTITSIGEHLPRLMETIFGVVVIGRYRDSPTNVPTPSFMTLQPCKDNLCFDLKQFWEVEAVPTVTADAGTRDDPAEIHFQKTHFRLEDGRFGVSLPFRGHPPDLHGSAAIAKRRFYHLESKFARNPALKTEYTNFMADYLRLGHMAKASMPSRYVIPHHAVYNRNKIRVVFDASSQTPNGSLNQALHIGPALQNDLRQILLNFRIHPVAFITDAVKMYRQIQVSQDDRAYQHIYWREDPSDPLCCYELQTVTYGVACAPFLALRCLQQLETEHRAEFPLAAQVLRRDLYVDDIATGAASESQALALQQELIQLLRKGQFELAKWASNSPALLSTVAQPATQTVSHEFASKEDSQKVLGLKWNTKADTFSYHFEQERNRGATKRTILSTVARIFDPLGFLSPCTIILKVLIQRLWLAKVSWDEEVPPEVQTQWDKFCETLPSLSRLEVPRCVVPPDPSALQFIGFCDSSSSAYGAIVYLRVVEGDKIAVRLLFARTRVAPTSGITIPKLELCAATLLVQMLQSLESFRLTVGPAHLWFDPILFTDSSVALAWIQVTSPDRLKTFVSNRVAQIKQATSSEWWRHIPGPENPADVTSRGIYPDALAGHSLYWNGPEWLSRPLQAWPSASVSYPTSLPELKTGKVTNLALFACDQGAIRSLEWMSRFSSYRRLIRVTALILRAVHNKQHPQQQLVGGYSLHELTKAFLRCIKLVQLYYFFRGDTANLPAVQVQHKTLNPFLDSHGVLRVGGRIQNADLPYHQKHPILLPHASHFVRLLLECLHVTYMHAGPSLLQTLLQQRFWVPGMRRLTRSVVRNCVTCFQLRAPNVVPIMGDLPSSRLSAVRPFLHTGMDFAGPFCVRDSLRRKAPVSKAYMCIFVCMATKAVHLEAVTSLSTESFLATLIRFISRRGVPSDLYSDNGTNFVGASRELSTLLQWYNEEYSQGVIVDFTANRGINFHFSPPYTPHFGGLWEAGVKSVKHHLTTTVKDTPLTFEELSTLLCQVEAILNSRPLCPLSEDTDNLDVLTPGHFLTGAPLVAIPEPSLIDEKINSLSRWQLVKRSSELIWTRWRTEYLATLQRRSKWHRDPAVYLQPGDLVLVRDLNAPPLKWPRARVLSTQPGKDGRPRVASIQTSKGVYSRGVVNLIPLLPVNQGREPSL